MHPISSYSVYIFLENAKLWKALFGKYTVRRYCSCDRYEGLPWMLHIFCRLYILQNSSALISSNYFQRKGQWWIHGQQQQQLCTGWMIDSLTRLWDKCGNNVSFIEDALIQKGILLLIAAARDVVFIMFNNTRTSFWFGPTATSSRDLERLSPARLTLNINFSSLNQCWPGRKEMDLNSIKVRAACFHSPPFHF